jgi:hypothetical protein
MRQRGRAACGGGLGQVLYYLAATVTFPRNPAEWTSLDDYFAKRKGFVASLMLATEFAVSYSYRDVLIDTYQRNPEKFWHWTVPYNIAIKLAFLALIFVRGRTANRGAGGMILLFLLPYWHRA